jgi:hypothetical protein
VCVGNQVCDQHEIFTILPAHGKVCNQSWQRITALARFFAGSNTLVLPWQRL